MPKEKNMLTPLVASAITAIIQELGAAAPEIVGRVIAKAGERDRLMDVRQRANIHYAMRCVERELEEEAAVDKLNKENST